MTWVILGVYALFVLWLLAKLLNETQLDYYQY